MDPPTYTALASGSRTVSSSLPLHEPTLSSVVPTVQAPSASSSSPPSSSAVSLLLAPLEGRSTFLAGQLLPPPHGLLNSPPGTVFWDGQDRSLELDERSWAGGLSEVRGEVMTKTKGVQPSRVEQLAVALKLTLRRNGQADEVLFERSVVVFPPPSAPAPGGASGSPAPSSSVLAATPSPQPSPSSLAGPAASSTTPTADRPVFAGSRHPFAIPIPSTLPQCLHQPSLSLSYTLSAALTVRPAPASSPSASPLSPPEVHRESMEIHLCPSGRPSSQASPLIRTVPAPGRTPMPVLVGFPKTRCRKSEQVRLWVEIPIPDQRALERGVGLRNVRAELWRVITITSAASSSSSATATEKGIAPRTAIPPSKVAQSPAGFGNGSSSISTLLTTTGSSCRFSPLSPIRLRLSVLAPLSPSSAYQLTCGHLTQQVKVAHETVDVRFWVKVMVGFVGAGVEEVECEQEVVVLGDLEEDVGGAATVHKVDSGSPETSPVSSLGIQRTPDLGSDAADDRPFTKEKIFEGETYRQSDGIGPSASASSSSAPPLGFAEPLPSFTPHPIPSHAAPHSIALSHDPPPFSDLPAVAGLRGGAPEEAEPPSPSGSSSRPPPFTPLAAALADPSPPPPTFFEAVPQPELISAASSIPSSDSPTSASYPLAPFLNLPPQVAPPTLPSADPANLPAEWLETDGYESFSLPPPPVSVGLETEGSVDPPAEGEGPVDRGRLEQIYDSISPAALRRSTSASPSPVAVTRPVRVRDATRVDDPNDLPPTFRDLAIASTSLADEPPPPRFRHFGPGSVIEQLPSHPSEVRSEQRRVAREAGSEVVPPPYAGGELNSGTGVSREGDEGGEQPPMYS